MHKFNYGDIVRLVTYKVDMVDKNGEVINSFNIPFDWDWHYWENKKCLIVDKCDSSKKYGIRNLENEKYIAWIYEGQLDFY